MIWGELSEYDKPYVSAGYSISVIEQYGSTYYVPSRRGVLFNDKNGNVVYFSSKDEARRFIEIMYDVDVVNSLKRDE